MKLFFIKLFENATYVVLLLTLPIWCGVLAIMNHYQIEKIQK